MKCLPLALLLTLSITAKSQKEESFYVFDANWKPTKIESAHFLLHTFRVNDTCWQFDFYKFLGPLIKTEQYRDKEGSQINGISRHYNDKGVIDSIGNFQHGKRNGEFFKLVGDPLKYKWEYIYRDDSLIEVIDLEKQKKDSVLLYKDDEKESTFPGGLPGWQRYMIKNLKYPERAINGDMQGQVGVVFIIDKEGNVIDPYIFASVEYSLDEEALRIIKKSGKWVPAYQNGHNVKSYKRQPINFRLQ